MTGRGGKVWIGVCGTGAISQLMHLPILSERPDVELAAVSDPDGLKVRSVAVVAGRAESEPPTEQVALMRLVEAAYRSARKAAR